MTSVSPKAWCSSPEPVAAAAHIVRPGGRDWLLVLATAACDERARAACGGVGAARGGDGACLGCPESLFFGVKVVA